MTLVRRSRRRSLLPLLVVALTVARAATAAPMPASAVRELSGHNSSVTSVAVFPDGKLALTGSRDRTLKIWDLANARVARTLEGHTGPVLAVAVSADGKRIASGGNDHVVRVWDPATGDLLAMLQGHTGDVVGVAFLPDGQVVSGGGDGLRRWDVDKEETVWRTPADGGGAFDLAVSADGRRAAFVNIYGGDVEVWDLAARRLVRRLEARTGGYLNQGLAISPDGREVIGRGERGGIARWDADSGKKLPVPDGFGGNRMVFSRDGALAAAGGPNNGAAVWDARNWRKLGSFEGSKAMTDAVLGLAFAPDNKTLLATTGFHLPTKIPAHTDQSDKLLVYDVTDAGAAPETGAKAGKLSWDELTVRFKPTSGETVDAAASPLRRRTLFPRALTDGLDAFYSDGVHNTGAYLLLHRTPGLFEQVTLEPDAHLDDVAWDGRHVWVASRRYGILLFDRDGKPVDRISAPAGLLPAANILKLHVLGPGRVLAAGLDGERGELAGTGWCAIVERPADGAPVKVNTFFRESQLPESWKAGSDPKAAHFAPRWISEPPPSTDAAGKTVRSVWVICANSPSSESAILRVDPDALTVAAYNIQMPNQRPIVTTMLPQGNPPCWVSPREFLYHVGYAYRAAVGEFVINPADRKLVVHSAWPNRGHDQAPFLRVGDQIYLPGQRWHRIDPRGWQVEDIGPGLRVDGNLAEDDVQYFVSGVLHAPAAYVTDGGRLYAFSVDPARPRKIPATLDPPRGRPIPPDGAVEFTNNQTVFYCGQGALRFSKGRLVGNYNVDYPYRNPKADLDAESARVDSMCRRTLPRIGGDRERVGLTDDQVRRLTTGDGRRIPPGPDAAKLQALFAAWEAAAPGPARDEAAKPLFAAARAAGEWDAQVKRDGIARVRGIVTARQWKLLNYEIPTDADK